MGRKVIENSNSSAFVMANAVLAVAVTLNAWEKWGWGEREY